MLGLNECGFGQLEHRCVLPAEDEHGKDVIPATQQRRVITGAGSERGRKVVGTAAGQRMALEAWGLTAWCAVPAGDSLPPIAGRKRVPPRVANRKGPGQSNRLVFCSDSDVWAVGRMGGKEDRPHIQKPLNFLALGSGLGDAGVNWLEQSPISAAFLEAHSRGAVWPGAITVPHHGLPGHCCLAPDHELKSRYSPV